VTPTRYSRSSWREFSLHGRPKVAVVYVLGEIVSGESQSGGLGGQTIAGSDTIARAVREAREDSDVKAIVVRVDSPGGSGTASDVIWRELRQARKEKPVVASMSDVAASGGYYVSMGADAIVAEPTTITGSIGVFAGKFSMHGLFDKLGITEETVTRGRHSDLFTVFRPWNDEERAKVRTLITAFYTVFVNNVAESRGRGADEIDRVAQGRVWTGREALAHGLVDRLGGLEDAVEVAKEKAKIAKSQDVELVAMPEPKGLLETLFEPEETLTHLRIPAELRTLLRAAPVLDEGRPATRLPFDLAVR
jgi:protease-4